MRQCYFCANNTGVVDYKDTENLKRFLDPFSKIVPRKQTGVCAKHQRKLSQAIKRSRFMALIPFVSQ